MALSKMIKLGVTVGEPRGSDKTILASKYINNECNYIYMSVEETRETFMEMPRTELGYLDMFRYDLKRRPIESTSKLVEFTEQFFK